MLGWLPGSCYRGVADWSKSKWNPASSVRVLLLRSSLFMVLWQSPAIPFLSCFLVTCGSSTLELHALLSMCSASCWSIVFGSRHSCLVSGSVLVSCWGSDTHILGLVLLRERAVSSLLGPCAPLSVCIVFVSTWFGFACFFIVSLFAFACFVLFCVGHSLCFSLAECIHVCHVCEHAAYESPY